MITNFPLLNMYASIQNIIDYGRGLASNVVGQPGTVYRVTSASGGDIIQTANAIYTNFPVLRRVIHSDPSVESHGNMDLVVFDVVCNLNLLEVGDIWVQTDPYYGAGADLTPYPTDEFIGFTLAHHAVMKRAIAIQVQRFANIYRMSQGAASQGGYASAFQQQATNLQIINGQAVFANAGVPANIPIGMNPRTGGFVESLHPDIRSLPDSGQYSIYIPPIQGYAPVEGDIIQTAYGARFSVIVPWHLDAGVVGNTVIARKVNPQSKNMGDF